MLGTVLLVLLVLMLVGASPQIGWHSYGYGPSGGIGLILLIILILFVMGRL